MAKILKYIPSSEDYFPHIIKLGYVQILMKGFFLKKKYLCLLSKAQTRMFMMVFNLFCAVCESAVLGWIQIIVVVFH